LDKAQEDLSSANTLLEEKEKKVQEVGLLRGFIHFWVGYSHLFILYFKYLDEL